MSLTRKDLDARVCNEPGCGHTSHTGSMGVTGRCHKGAPVRVKYRAGDLTVTCDVCGELVVRIAVAEGLPA
jgi:hypothetical protein